MFSMLFSHRFAPRFSGSQRDFRAGEDPQEKFIEGGRHNPLKRLNSDKKNKVNFVFRTRPARAWDEFQALFQESQRQTGVPLYPSSHEVTELRSCRKWCLTL